MVGCHSKGNQKARKTWVKGQRATNLSARRREGFRKLARKKEEMTKVGNS